MALQGEGRNTGRVAAFIRFAGCNLDCMFADGSICDTPWRKAKEKTTVGEVVEWAVNELLWPPRVPFPNPDNRPMAVLTGGEPTMAPAFDELVKRLQDTGFYVAVETNGTLWRDGLAFADWVAVSPKDGVTHVNPSRTDPRPDERVLRHADEMRYVITDYDAPAPPINPHATHHYVSPAMRSDGKGKVEAHPQFVPGAVPGCIGIILKDPPLAAQSPDPQMDSDEIRKWECKRSVARFTLSRTWKHSSSCAKCWRTGNGPDRSSCTARSWTSKATSTGSLRSVTICCVLQPHHEPDVVKNMIDRIEGQGGVVSLPSRK